MRTVRFLTLSFVACATTLFVAAAADAQQDGNKGDGGGRQRGGQRGPGGGGFGGGAFGGGGFGGPGGGGGFTIDRATMLGVEQIKEELKIDDSQSVTISAAIDAYRKEREDSRPDRSAFENLSEDERTALSEKMRKDREALSKKTDEMLNALLEPEQVERLDQISLQSRMRLGLAALLKSDEIRTKLTITDEQVTKLDGVEKETQAAQEKMREEMRAAFQNGGGGGERPSFDQMRERGEAARKETETKVMALLTDDQKSKLDEMKGKPFEIDFRQLMGGRGGFGGPGGGGGPGGRGRGEGGDQGGGGRRRPASESESI